MAVHNLEQTVTFGSQDFAKIQIPHEDPLVVTIKISNCLVKRILVDKGSAVKVMFYSTFIQIGLPNKEIVPALTPLIGFDGVSMIPMGTVRLEVTVGERLLMVEFFIVNVVSLYNAIMGRGWIHSMKGIPSTVHQVMRYISDKGVVFDFQRDQMAARKCLNVTSKGKGKLLEVKKES